MESPRLPPQETLAHGFSGIRNLPTAALQSRMNIYARILQKRYGHCRSSSTKWNPKLLLNKSHWAQMSKPEMQAVLIVEYMKWILGKTKSEAVEELLDLKP